MWGSPFVCPRTTRPCLPPLSAESWAGMSGPESPHGPPWKHTYTYHIITNQSARVHCFFHLVWFELGLTSNQHRKVIRRRGPRFKVSSDWLVERGNRTSDPWVSSAVRYPLHHGTVPNVWNKGRLHRGNEKIGVFDLSYLSWVLFLHSTTCQSNTEWHRFTLFMRNFSAAR